MWPGYRISFGLLGLAALSGVLACSGQGSTANSNDGGSTNGSAGMLGAFASSGAAGLGGFVGSAGAASGASTAGQAGASNLADGGANSGGFSHTGLGGTSGSVGSAGASGSASAGSSGVGPVAGSGGGSAAFAQVAGMLGKNCGIKGCHADKQSPHFVPDGMLYAMLTGPNTVLAECDYTRLVEEGDPSRSALVRLMNRKCGSFTMPPTCNKATCLSSADLQALSDWISAGAPP
ncbi:MAG TPA: hypothetical protein VGC79_01670 [Polyangiaceae bacterium]